MKNGTMTDMGELVPPEKDKIVINSKGCVMMGFTTLGRIVHDTTGEARRQFYEAGNVTADLLIAEMDGEAIDDCILNYTCKTSCDGCAKRCGGELEVIESMKHDGATVLKVSQVTLEAIIEHACGLRVEIDDTMHDGQMLVE